MKKWIGWLGLVVAGLVGIVLVCTAAVYGFSEARYRKQWAITPASIPVPTDSLAIARGDHIVHSLGGCVDCHGENLAGKKMIDDPAFGRVYSLNLTRGKGGASATLSDVDFIRAIRHGIGPNGRALKVMPSSDYDNLSDADLVSVIAYIKSLPAVDNELPPSSVGPLARALMVAGKLPLLNAEQIDHDRRHPATVTAEVTPAYGSYLASVGCKGCHGPQLAGGPIPGGPPDWPPAANLTPAGNLKDWSEADFRNLLRTGKRPNGIPVNAVMPWKVMGKMTDEEIGAIYLYLRSLPPQQTPGVQKVAVAKQ
jgi:mono/diheme cytochrome c family protein